MSRIYHITTSVEWKKAQDTGAYIAPALKEEGFIHCCEEAQVGYIKDLYYKNETDLVKLCIDTEKLTSQFVFEWSPSLEQTFPHIYGPINIDAVDSVDPL